MQAVSPEYRDIVNKCLEETTNEMIDLIQEKYIRTRRGKDGKILTIDIRYLMKQQKLFGAISRSKLASKLQREGIEIKVDDPQHGFYHVKGIDRDIEDKFSTRTAENKKTANVHTLTVYLQSIDSQSLILSFLFLPHVVTFGFSKNSV